MNKSSDGAASATSKLPHSWDVRSWPQEVWPGSGPRARWILGAYRGELLAEGALARTAKVLVILGAGYQRWLNRRIAQVGDFQSNNASRRQQRAA